MIELEIEYHLADSDPINDDADRFHRVAEWIARRRSLNGLAASVAIVDDPTIHRLNREHLDHDWPTDVISFVFDDSDGRVNGEVIASVDTARRLAVKAGWSAEDELLLYVSHGLLHLAGLDDIEADDRAEMRSTEQDLLTDMGIHGAAEYLAKWHDISY